MAKQRSRERTPMVNPKAAARMAALWHPSMEFMKTVDGMINEVATRKNQYPHAGLRKIAYMLGVLPDVKPTAENVVVAGCAPPFLNINMVQAYFRVLERFGVDFTVLDDEVCCGWLPIEGAFVGGNEAELKKAEGAAKGFMKQNVDAAVEKGGKTMLHFCEWCIYTYNWAKKEGAFTSTGSQINHVPAVAPLLEKADNVTMRMKEHKTIGYYTGCYRRSDAIFPEIKVDWSVARKLMGKIENATIVDLPSTCCMTDAEKVIEDAKKRKCDVIVNRCYPCSVYTTLAAKGTIPVQFITETLEEATRP